MIKAEFYIKHAYFQLFLSFIQMNTNHLFLQYTALCSAIISYIKGSLGVTEVCFEFGGQGVVLAFTWQTGGAREASFIALFVQRKHNSLFDIAANRWYFFVDEIKNKIKDCLHMNVFNLQKAAVTRISWDEREDRRSQKWESGFGPLRS